MGKLNISASPPEMVDLIWGRCEAHIQRVVDVAHGEITTESVKARLKAGNSVLVVISEGAEIIACNVVEVRVMDSGLRALYIPITGGDRMSEWMEDFLRVAKAIAKDFNCTELRGLAVRKGWMRVLEKHDWETVHTVIKCEIGE